MIPLGLQNNQKLNNMLCWGREQQRILYTVGGNVIWYNLYGEQLTVDIKVKHAHTPLHVTILFQPYSHAK